MPLNDRLVTATTVGVLKQGQAFVQNPRNEANRQFGKLFRAAKAPNTTDIMSVAMRNPLWMVPASLAVMGAAWTLLGAGKSDKIDSKDLVTGQQAFFGKVGLQNHAIMFFELHKSSKG